MTLAAISVRSVVDRTLLPQGELYLRDFPILPPGNGWCVSSTRNEGSFRK
jgi:hypothetical protein